MARTTHVHDQSLGLQMSGQNLDNRRSLQASVDLDTVLNDLRMKLQRNGTRCLQRIQDPHIALKDCGSRSSQVGSHNMQGLGCIRDLGIRQVNPLLLKGSPHDHLKGIHRLQTLTLRCLPELRESQSGRDIIQADLLKEFLNFSRRNPVCQSRCQDGPNADPLDALGKLQGLMLCQILQSSDQQEPTHTSASECNCRKHFYRMGSRDVECS